MADAPPDPKCIVCERRRGNSVCSRGRPRCTYCIRYNKVCVYPGQDFEDPPVPQNANLGDQPIQENQANQANQNPPAGQGIRPGPANAPIDPAFIAALLQNAPIRDALLEQLRVAQAAAVPQAQVAAPQAQIEPMYPQIPRGRARSASPDRRRDRYDDDLYGQHEHRRPDHQGDHRGRSSSPRRRDDYDRRYDNHRHDRRHHGDRDRRRSHSHHRGRHHSPRRRSRSRSRSWSRSISGSPRRRGDSRERGRRDYAGYYDSREPTPTINDLIRMRVSHRK